MFDEERYSLYSQPMGVDLTPEPHKFVIVLLFLTLAGFSNWWSLAYIHDFVGREPLPDLVMTFIPEQAWAHRIGDMMVFLCSTIMILVMILHKHRVIVARRIFFILGCMYWMRTISMMATQLPSAYSNNEEKCRVQLNESERTWSIYWGRFLEQTIHVGFQDVENKMLCGDLLFSGHTLVMVISYLTVDYYLPRKWNVISYLPRFFMLAGMICMVLSRTHYTIDVLFAYWLSVGVFSTYHVFCEVDTYRERKNSILQKIFVVKAVSWLEENIVPGRLNNELEVPFWQCIKSKCQAKGSHQSHPTTVVTVCDV
ncbi:unnamed protein product [Bursaphelenchus xylophilus]|uniref:(pine wood nematode) hypothetical protein n=1 Tax=Bursaphelenchus xylophilus TaxID=6326 RepID=A0A1I7SSS4_BURXY|nr:unnamed protein product [Bursaphelenchus xylophilus]CAG9108898.1 unnamed protein product [Bursaphelenchus xylophilus]